MLEAPKVNVVPPSSLKTAPKAEDKRTREVTELEAGFKEFCKSIGVRSCSFSKLNSVDGCEYSYHKTYVLGERGKDNVYSFIGSAVHDALEDFTNGECDIKDTIDRFNTALKQCEMTGLYFPTDKIKQSYIKNITRSLCNYTNPFGECDEIRTEEFICGMMGNSQSVPMLGFIDVLCFKTDENGVKYAEIYDFKTSSKYSNDKIREYGRQLLVYKLMVERFLNIEVRNVGWVMLKYAVVNGKRKGSTKVVEWQDVCDDSAKQYIKFYDYTMEDVDEVDTWIDEKIERIKHIESIPEANQKPINFKKEGTFFCTNLCGHSKDCIHFKKYQDSQTGGYGGY